MSVTCCDCSTGSSRVWSNGRFPWTCSRWSRTLTDTSQFSEYIEYVGAEEYDQENGPNGPEIPFYLELARQTGGPVLDLACGTGYLTIPLAQSGLSAVGVDLAPEMLDHARSKSGNLPIEWALADCRTFDLERQFKLVTMTGNAFQEFRTRADLEALLETVRRHLAPDGLFSFDTRFPQMSDLLTPESLSGEWSPETPWRTFEDEHGRMVNVSTQQRYDAISQIAEYVVLRRWQEAGQEQTLTERAVLRFIFPQEMVALLHYNGFAIREVYGDWDRRPLDGTSPRMIYVCSHRS